MDDLYSMIFKRKSVRRAAPAQPLREAELEALRRQLPRLLPLDGNEPVAYRLVKTGQTTCRFGEYCLLCYCNHTQPGLLNAGYLLEQMDLFLAQLDIGVCWHGIGKPDLAQWQGLPYTVMLALGKSRAEDFRQDIAQAKRKPWPEIWQGDCGGEAFSAARYAPSACNLQPWRVQSEGGTLRVYRTQDGKSAILPVRKRPFYNTLDLGIFLCFFELSLTQGGQPFTRTLIDAPLINPPDGQPVPVAVYSLTADDKPVT